MTIWPAPVSAQFHHLTTWPSWPQHGRDPQGQSRPCCSVLCPGSDRHLSAHSLLAGLAPAGVPGRLAQHPIPVLFHGPVLWGCLGGPVEARELPRASRLGVLGPRPGQPLASDSIHPGHEGQLVSAHHYAALNNYFRCSQHGRRVAAAMDGGSCN